MFLLLSAVGGNDIRVFGLMSGGRKKKQEREKIYE